MPAALPTVRVAVRAQFHVPIKIFSIARQPILVIAGFRTASTLLHAAIPQVFVIMATTLLVLRQALHVLYAETAKYRPQNNAITVL